MAKYLILILLTILLTGCDSYTASDDMVSRSKHSVTFSGEVDKDQQFIRSFGDRFTFVLQPIDHGWMINILDERGDHDISRITTPWNFVPNHRAIEGWHFRNSDNTGANAAGPKNVNAPQEVRNFIFSPEVGRTIDGPNATRKPTSEEIQHVGEFGRGTLTIVEYRLNNLTPEKRAGFTWMKFNVELSWNEE